MRFGDFFKSFGKSIITAIKTVTGTILNAKLETIVKVGTFIGTTLVVAGLTIKSLINKARMNKHHIEVRSNDALSLNFADARNYSKLGPEFNSIKKEFRTHKTNLKNKKKFNSKKINKKMRSLLSQSNMFTSVSPIDKLTFSEFEREAKSVNESVVDTDMKDFELRNSWIGGTI